MRPERVARRTKSGGFSLACSCVSAALANCSRARPYATIPPQYGPRGSHSRPHRPVFRPVSVALDRWPPPRLPSSAGPANDPVSEYRPIAACFDGRYRRSSHLSVLRESWARRFRVVRRRFADGLRLSAVPAARLGCWSLKSPRGTFVRRHCSWRLELCRGASCRRSADCWKTQPDVASHPQPRSAATLPASIYFPV